MNLVDVKFLEVSLRPNDRRLQAESKELENRVWVLGRVSLQVFDEILRPFGCGTLLDKSESAIHPLLFLLL
jgi:hypothetical protein